MSRGALESPELALVDPDLRARALQTLHPPDDTLTRVPERSRPRRARPDLPASTSLPSALESDEANEALRRLTELSELEPVTRQRRSTKLLSLAFAASAWGTLALIAADLQLWRL